MIDKIIGVIIVLAIIAAIVILLFVGVWLTVFCKTMKEINRAERELNRPHIKYRR